MILKMAVVPIIKRKLPDVWYAVPLIVFIVFCLRCGDPILALKMHLIVYCVFGFAFKGVLFCGHRQREMWTEGA